MSEVDYVKTRPKKLDWESYDVRTRPDNFVSTTHFVGTNLLETDLKFTSHMVGKYTGIANPLVGTMKHLVKEDNHLVEDDKSPGWRK